MAMTDRVAKTLLYEQFARVGKALASPVRLELLDLLAQGERGVEDLAAAAGLRLSNASAQLQVLASAGLATCRRSGRRVYYRLAGDAAGLLAPPAQQVACERGGAGKGAPAASRPATFSFWTCDRPPNTPPGTSPAPWASRTMSFPPA